MLSCPQHFLLNAAGPLIATMEELTVVNYPDPKSVPSGVQQAMIFIGNIAGHFIHGQRSNDRQYR